MQKLRSGCVAAASPASIPPNLLPLLNQERSVLEKLLSLTEKERKATRMRDLQLLEDVSAAKREALSDLQEMESRREEMLDKWAKEAGLGDAKITISDLLDYAPARERDLLAGSQEQLASLVERVSEANRVNAALLVQVLSSVQNSLAFILSLQSREFAYSSNGAAVTTKRSGKTIIERCA